MLFALQQIWTPGTQRTDTWCYTLSATEQATWKTCHTTTYSQQLTVGRRLLEHVIYRGKVGCEFLIRITRGTSESSARSVPKTGLTKSQRKSYVPPNNNLMVSCHSCCWSEPRLSHRILLAGFSCRSLCDLRLQKLTPKKQIGGNKEANCVPCSLALQLVTSSIYFFGLSEMRSMWLCSHGEAVLLYLVVSRVGPERSCVRLWFI